MRRNSILTGPLTIFAVALWCGFSDPAFAQSTKKPAATSSTGTKKASTTPAKKAPAAAVSKARPAGTKTATPVKATAAAKPVAKKSEAKPAATPAKKTVAKTSPKPVTKPVAKKSSAPAAPKPVAKAKPAKAPAKPVAAPKAGLAKSPAKGKPVAAARGVQEGRSDRTPAPPAKLSRTRSAEKGSDSTAATKARSGGSEVKASLNPASPKPPFSPEDGEDATIVNDGVTDDFSAEEVEVQGTGEALGAPVIPAVSAIEKAAQAESPMVFVLGLAGGAGAAALMADPLPPSERPTVPDHPLQAPPEAPEPVPTSPVSAAVSATAVPAARPPESLPPLAAPVPAQPDEVAVAAAVVAPSALTELPPATDRPELPPAASVASLPETPAPSPALAVAEPSPEGETLEEPVVAAEPAATEPPPAAADSIPFPPDPSPASDAIAAASSPAEASLPTGATPATPATPGQSSVPALSDLADLAAGLETLPRVSSRQAQDVSEALQSAVADPEVRRKPKATLTALAQKHLSSLPSGDARVVAASLMQALPDDDVIAETAKDVEKDSGQQDVEKANGKKKADDALLAARAEAESTRPAAPDRLASPAARDELAPKRADRSGTAFEVPATAGDLLIAANSQTDFQVEERRVVFSGEVIMKNERFFLTADKLVAYMKENQSGLEFAEAQGNVVVRMVENGRETGSSGLAKTAVFHPETGEIVLKGWPQLRMGNKAHVASAATTEMSLFTDGRMKTSGRNQTMIVP